METRTETIHNGLGKLLQAGRHGKLAEKDRRMDEETNPYGILETLETSEDKIPKSGKAGNQPFQCRNTGKYKKRVLADCRESNTEYRIIQ